MRRLGVVLLLLLLASTASADLVVEEGITLDIPLGEAPCVMFEHSRANPLPCEGFDKRPMLDTIEGLGRKPMYAAFVRRKDWGFFFMLASTDTKTLGKGVPREKIGDVDVETAVSHQEGETKTIHLLSKDDRTYLIAVSTRDEHAEETKTIVQRALQSVQIAKPAPPPPPPPAVPKWTWIAGAALGVSIAVVAVRRILQKPKTKPARSKKRATPR